MQSVRRVVRMVLLLVFAAAMVAAPAAADDVSRDGLLVSVCPGLGYADLSFLADEEFGYSSAIGFGWHVRPDLAVGFQGNIWWRKKDDVTTVGRVDGFFVTWYPTDAHLYVVGALGSGHLEARGPGGTAEDSGLGTTISVGYEVRVRSAVGIGPRFDANYIDVEGAESKSLSLSLAANFYP